MNFRCRVESLRSAVEAVFPALSGRATLPVLSGIRVAVSADGHVSVTADDLEMRLECRFPVRSRHPGSAVISGSLLRRTLRALPDGAELDIEASDEHLHFAFGSRRVSLKAIDDEGYPATEPDPAPATSWRASDLMGALKQVVVAVSGDESRQVLTGVLWESEETELVLAATDSYRLAVKKVPLTGAPVAKAIIPGRVCEQLTKVLSGAHGRVEGMVSAERLWIRSKTNHVRDGIMVVSGHHIDGEFPNYQQLIPDHLDLRIQVDRSAFEEAVRVVSMGAHDNLPIRLSVTEQAIEMEAHTPDLASAAARVPASVDPPPGGLRIAFNPAFLLEAVRALASGYAVLEAKHNLHPAVFRGHDDPTYQHLLMPVRLGDAES